MNKDEIKNLAKQHFNKKQQSLFNQISSMLLVHYQSGGLDMFKESLTAYFADMYTSGFTAAHTLCDETMRKAIKNEIESVAIINAKNEAWVNDRYHLEQKLRKEFDFKLSEARKIIFKE